MQTARSPQPLINAPTSMEKPHQAALLPSGVRTVC
jgi:hypothetical protein